MKLSTYIRAAIATHIEEDFTDRAFNAYMRDGDERRADGYIPHLIRKGRQRRAFHARALQLADERHDLIQTLDAQLDEFTRKFKEAHDGI